MGRVSEINSLYWRWGLSWEAGSSELGLQILDFQVRISKFWTELVIIVHFIWFNVVLFYLVPKVFVAQAQDLCSFHLDPSALF